MNRKEPIVRRTAAAALTGGVVLALSVALAPAASAQSEPVQIKNAHFGKCLTANFDRTVGLGPCDGSEPVTWTFPLAPSAQIRSVLTGECLTDVDDRGDVALRPCTDGDQRQQWDRTGPAGVLLQNTGTGRILVANDAEIVYASEPGGEHAIWYTDPAGGTEPRH